MIRLSTCMIFWNILWFLEYYCWPLSFTFLTLQQILWSSLNMGQVEISLVVWIYHIGKQLVIMWMYSTVLYVWQRMGLCFALPLIFCKHTCANIIRRNGNYIGQILSRELWCAEPSSNSSALDIAEAKELLKQRRWHWLLKTSFMTFLKIQSNFKTVSKCITTWGTNWMLNCVDLRIYNLLTAI